MLFTRTALLRSRGKKELNQTVRRSTAHAARLRMQPGLAAGLGELADAQDVALALSDGDDAAGVEQIEDVARLDALVVGRQRHRPWRARGRAGCSSGAQ